VPGCRLEARGIARAFGGVTAVEDVSFVAEASGITGIVGPNGAGKTTLLNLLTGVYRADHGTLLVDGRQVRVWRPHQRARLGIARTFQAARVFPNLNVFENVLVGADCRRTTGSRPQRHESGAGLRAEVTALLGALGLAGRARDRAVDLPSGAQKMVELARVLITRPRVVLLDEPASGLGEGEAARLAGALVAVRDLGVTVVIVDHNLRLVMGICDQVIVMDAGRVIAAGQPAAVQADPAVREAYLGAAAPWSDAS
jgi:branched-chain amino acid transport system ATP-binding protein